MYIAKYVCWHKYVQIVLGIIDKMHKMDSASYNVYAVLEN